MTLGSEGTISIGVTTQGQVLLTIHAEDGTEVNMALTWRAWIRIAETVKAQWLNYHKRLDIARRDKLKKEARDAMS